MATSIYLLTLGLPLATVLLVFGMKYFSAASAARARLAGEASYRALAEQALAAQVQNQAALSAIQAELAKLTASLAAVEKMLKQVE
jgi:hypothetical protein